MAAPRGGGTVACSRSGDERVMKRQKTTSPWPEPGAEADETADQPSYAPGSPFMQAEMAPPLPIAKRVRDCRFPPMLLEDDILGEGFSGSSQMPQLRRQLTPRISWSSMFPESSQEDTFMNCASPLGTTTSPRGALRRLETPSPPPTSRKLSGELIAASQSMSLASPSPPTRPSKSRNSMVLSTATPCRRTAPDQPQPQQQESNRFAREFQGARIVGSGNFAVVYRARNSIDQQEYAIKKTKQPLARGSLRRREMLQEALALASVAIESPSPYIVRYFASWIEDDRLFIQTELCDGSLKDSMISLRQTRPLDPRFTLEELTPIVRDVCMGLSVLHSKNLVHLDVKPENVLVKKTSRQGSSTPAKIHKIADLGLATAAIGSGCDEISEGDSRYLAREVLRGDFTHLTKADVFSLGILCYELGTNPKELPCNGDDWHRLREGAIEERLVSQLHPTMIELMRRMLRPVAAERPPCTEVLRDPLVTGIDEDCVEELQKQLRVKTEVAELEMKKRATAEEKADRYWSELLQMKRQELVDCTSVDEHSSRAHRASHQYEQHPPKLARSRTA